MARKRDLSPSELFLYAAFGGLRMPVEQIKEAVAAGSRLELVESSFSDPGGDYTEILLDGKRIGGMSGY